MATTIPQRELRNNNADVINRVEAGESFTVTRNGVAIADIVPHRDRTKPPMFPLVADLVAAERSRGGVSVDLDAWLADIRAFDDLIDDDPLNSRG